MQVNNLEFNSRRVLGVLVQYTTDRPPLSAPLSSAELDYPRFLRPKLSTPNL